ncbi:spherulation-specific family 4 protein [Streptomyces sudanensis]|uniref:spherulation-specific family 4 protein n=1 Tax=Streptomyces sudanensis TaxID=436397 RepID=UPI0020CD26D9|nr:spherulation-specific family 4 protein [Streptomyces sudanensis]MCP9956217.1 spherulation-specific family 4 protein [Streptomyces sudanensis]MCQ0003148.1 spherulation-specific family 4 protein [Streptomyces sudanensis]
MSLLVPLYVHPVEDPVAWQRLAARADRVHAVVLNPASGPGRSPDPAFAAAAGALRAAGARLLGYVDTDYGSRDPGEVVADLRRHREWYAVDGCFLDRVTAGAHGLPACRRLVRSARRLGASTVVLNPGVHPAPGYVRLADLTVTFEGPWSTYVSAFSRPPWAVRQPPERLCHLVYGVPGPLVPLAVRTARERGAGVCGPVTGGPPNPWSGLTPALAEADR